VTASTLVTVAYRTTALDLSWVPDSVDVIVVHNDDSLALEAVRHPNVRHLHSEGNVGFGAAVNAALAVVTTARIVLCNPDAQATPEHWTALTDAGDDEVVVVPLLDGAGGRTSVVNAYPTPLSALLTGYRAGRLLPRGTSLRRLLSLALGRWGRTHTALTEAREGRWPLRTHWASGALVSLPTARVRDGGGFDPAYFLYMEDVDLCARMAQRHDGMSVRMAAVEPARHAVSASSGTGAQRAVVDHHYASSVRRYMRGRRGPGWRLAAVLMTPRLAFLGLRLRLRRDRSATAAVH
jgi:GT2 family glycosyltransferase